MSADDWWRGAVLYQIYPRSFMDSDGDGVGDLKGIAQKLDYVKSLGVDGIWLSPFFKSPMRDFGYDVADYCAVDPMFGTMADFDAVLGAAHERGLKVIIDQVWSHTSSDHSWFQQSCIDRTNEKADWYVWADPKPDGSPPNNWQAWFGGAAWSWSAARGQYYLHNFLPSQPDLNFRNPDVRAAILYVARFWLDRGVDGFRLDVTNYYVHDASLRDNPPSGNPKPALPRDMQVHQYNANQPETFEFISELRAVMNGYGGRMIVGELAPGSHSLMMDYTRGKDRLHTAYAFDFLREWPTVERMAQILSQWGEGPEDGWPSWAFSNHDVIRVASRWGEPNGLTPKHAAPLFLGLLLTLRGTIFLYQGEELGLPEADVPFDRLRDPWGIAGWPAAKGRDGCRTPIPWTTGYNAGFSTGEPWLPVDPRHLELCVDRQQQKLSTLLTTRQLLAMRKASVALSSGSFRIVKRGDGQITFERAAGAERMRAVFNFNSKPVTNFLDFRPELMWAHGATLSGSMLAMDPYSAAVLKLV